MLWVSFEMLIIVWFCLQIGCKADEQTFPGYDILCFGVVFQDDALKFDV